MADEYARANRAVWDRWTLEATDSEHHRDVAVFRSGSLSLRSIELHEVGDVAGKTLLHLLCNMGCDTLSWARQGAQVTGVDISSAAVAQAQALAAEAELAARFVCSDLYALPEVLHEQFDVVFSSYGALCWLPDLERWASIVRGYLKPGGVFYAVDMHPVAGLVEGEGTVLRVRERNAYFHATQPFREDVPTREAGRTMPLYSWSYSLGEVISALLAAGLRLEYVHEFPQTFYQQFPSLIPGDDRYWHWPLPENTLPLLFSIRATNPRSQ
ncbi:MAG TPA: class I SAM-dependent methyltransferase [Ktedonobacterales bacterium]|jgi:SAM-dependent methyltransferase|nr:class I SAM-dependent methyltransferase [Ktedonobacterales bacterium]